MLRNYWLLFSIFVCALFSPLLFAQSFQSERILNFESNIVINKDASIDVTEIISVYANQQQIIHGIVRKLPVHYTDSDGISHTSNYQLKQVLLNNEPSAYHVEQSYKQLMIYIGNANITLSPGIYVYTIQYHAHNAINFLKEMDEFYWNITGNNWDFPIIKVTTDIHLPSEAKILRYAGYTGVTGAKIKNFYVRQPSDNQITYITTQPLSPGEGLTIAIAWQKNIIEPPTILQQAKL